MACLLLPFSLPILLHHRYCYHDRYCYRCRCVVLRFHVITIVAGVIVVTVTIIILAIAIIWGNVVSSPSGISTCGVLTSKVNVVFISRWCYLGPEMTFRIQVPYNCRITPLASLLCDHLAYIHNKLYTKALSMNSSPRLSLLLSL